ncbi:DUF881 domain-containing protein [Clostridium grantii]|uniref:Uncharacterized conserved protein YlxW, UPF0749 family n=1 Tax=Clostridium grantii DSM 8605 TaxID=1121316 RepID=A0A1M5SHT8_9CLOT|nr:DUF881 domain-containing protein [Clostridium grantii]SHH37970.1 Uncharacterized conserved protein YlxW, UPF0749 family [Clostridium grantii DSM 8605]
MNKTSGKIALGIVSLLLGLMLTYQLRAVAKNKKITGNNDVATITIEVEKLTKQKADMQKQIDELQIQIQNYEKAVSEDTLSKALVQELDSTRMLLGSTDVQGEGIILTIEAEEDIFSAQSPQYGVDYGDLVRIVNELNYADAEAISINDIRITSRTGIRLAGNAIIINEEKISPVETVTIKAIGNKNKLSKALEFPGILDTGFTGFTTKLTPSDKVEISKYNVTLNFMYAKPINNN